MYSLCRTRVLSSSGHVCVLCSYSALDHHPGYAPNAHAHSVLTGVEGEEEKENTSARRANLQQAAGMSAKRKITANRYFRIALGNNTERQVGLLHG